MIRFFFLILFIFPSFSHADDIIFHEKFYPDGNGPFPAVILLHTSGGYSTVKKNIRPFLNKGYAVYTPDFFVKYCITKKNRFETWTKYRKPIENDLVNLVKKLKMDPKIDKQNVFASGYSNGGYWASFLAAKKIINAGVSQYGVWKWPRTFNGYPARYFDQNSNGVLALIGFKDTIQRYSRNSSEISKIEIKSKKFEVFIFKNAGHSWDCSRCRKDGYSQEVTKEALDKSIKFFEKYTK